MAKQKVEKKSAPKAASKSAPKVTKTAPKVAKTAPKVAKTAAPAKKAGVKSGSGGKEVIVGSLTDWPLGARLAALLKLPASASGVACFQTLGNHGDAVTAKVFEVKETISPSLEPFVDRIHAALDVCTWGRAASFKSTNAYHANLSPEELKAHLSTEYLVRSPAEALEARRLTPAQSLQRIEKAAAKFPIGCPRKSLLAYLEGGPLRDSVLEADAHYLKYLFVASPEAYNEVDERLFSLWARIAGDVDGPPQPQPPAPELGFDRFGAHRQKLVAAGHEDRAALDYFLRKRPMEHARWWPSTGVWVWEQLVADARGLIERVLAPAEAHGDRRHVELGLVEVLTSVLWLPESALEAGALDAVLQACASPALVPDLTLSRLRKDKEFQPLLASLKRTVEADAPEPVNVKVRQGRRLIQT